MSKNDIKKMIIRSNARPSFQFFDGAFGSYYEQITGDEGPCENANIERPDVVLDIHRRYIAAGAEAIKTNTYRANGAVIKDEGLLKEIISQGYKIAAQACRGTKAVVFADIGYITQLAVDESNHYLPVVQAFIENGAKRFLFETCAGFDGESGMGEAIRLIRERVTDAYIIVTFAAMQDGYTGEGRFYIDLMREAAAFGADVVGLNCLCGPGHMLPLFNGVKGEDFGGVTLVAMPNASYPVSLNGRMLFRSNSGYFAEKLAEIHELGVEILGGCCGTMPEHIALLRSVVEKSRRKGAAIEQPAPQTERKEKPSFAVDACDMRKIVAVEIDSPSGCDDSFVIDAAKAMKLRGADMITVADSPLSRARADSILMASRIKRLAGIDAMPHIACRDRNRIAIKAGLLGASLEGINKVLAITGDPIAPEERAKEKSVFSFNSLSLIAYLSSMNREVFAGSEFSICAALNVNAANFASELERAIRKERAGAQFFFTQAMFCERACKNFMDAKSELKAKLIAGVMPVSSYNNAVFLNNEVNGIDIPRELVELLGSAETGRERRIISREFTKGIIDRVYDAADGFYIVMPLKSLRLTGEIVEYIVGKNVRKGEI
ncbi:MAG: bifunctional homocysteine S-methyltransferase/methylenetetrahydrofolate reductase [Christensenellales bacterium]|jgi:methionine synthase I (cobalamin-dependent)/5,10-methylenetetrahydrofolate reductase